jgi:hypothetical protein
MGIGFALRLGGADMGGTNGCPGSSVLEEVEALALKLLDCKTRRAGTRLANGDDLARSELGGGSPTAFNDPNLLVRLVMNDRAAGELDVGTGGV